MRSGDGAEWEDVRLILEQDFENLDHEVAALYDEIERYARVANVMETSDRQEDAEYFRELAVDRYISFEKAIQYKKDADDYDF